jgi:hypothetical protein
VIAIRKTLPIGRKTGVDARDKRGDDAGETDSTISETALSETSAVFVYFQPVNCLARK